MIARTRLDVPPAGEVPEPARLLARCLVAGVPVVPTTLLTGDPAGTDVALVASLGPLAGGRVDLRALGPDQLVPAVPVDDVPSLAAGLRAAFALGGPVLLQEHLRAVHAGTAELRRGRSYDVVRAVEGQPHELPDATEVRTLHVPVLLRRTQRPHRGADEWRTPLPPWAMRLARALRSARRALGDSDLDVVWSDDGRACRLLAVRRPT